MDIAAARMGYLGPEHRADEGPEGKERGLGRCLAARHAMACGVGEEHHQLVGGGKMREGEGG